jgi:hypothetical protein
MIARHRAALAALFLSAACGGDAGDRVTITLQVPAEDSGGAVLGDIDELVFDVSQAGELRARQVYRLADGLPEELSITDVPVGDNVTFHLIGSQLDAEVAYGQTCPVAVPEGDAELDPLLLYFSRVGRFRDSGLPLDPGRRAGLMFSDYRGIAFLAGGSDDGVVEAFDARDGLFAEVGDAAPRVSGALAVRSDGTAILAGGADADGDPVGRVEEIAPNASADDERVVSIGRDPQEPAERTGLALAALPDRSVLLAGGRDPDGLLRASVALLTAGDDEFRTIGATMSEERAGHTASLGLGGVVYLIGGLTFDDDAVVEAPTGSVELYRPQDQSMRLIEGAVLAVPRYRHTATVLEDGRVLIVGGVTCAPEPCDDAVGEVEIFDPVLGETRTVTSGAPIPGGIVDHTATVVAGGRVLITGGRDADGALREDAWLFDPDVEALVPTRPLTHARAQHTATALCDGTVLLVGGESDDGASLPAERYNPASRAIP